jgi:hypothetical protein
MTLLREKLMAKNSRTIIIVGLVLLGAMALAYYLFKQKEQEMISATMQGLAAGRSYGNGVAQKECIAGVQMLYTECEDNVCAVAAHGFIAACMEAAKKDDFCLGVPAPGDSKAAIDWAAKTCAAHQIYNAKCEGYLQKVLAVCYEQTTGKKRDTSEIIRDGFNRGYQKSQ